MFVFDDSDHVAGLKPMNCPESMLIFKTALRSYRDLPMRLADYSWLFRNERTGALAGMFRVRAADAGRLARHLPRGPGHRRGASSP